LRKAEFCIVKVILPVCLPVNILICIIWINRNKLPEVLYRKMQLIAMDAKRDLLNGRMWRSAWRKADLSPVAGTGSYPIKTLFV
jgi:hypothetical protein